jgi:hypothetical protein
VGGCGCLAGWAGRLPESRTLWRRSGGRCTAHVRVHVYVAARVLCCARPDASCLQRRCNHVQQRPRGSLPCSINDTTGWSQLKSIEVYSAPCFRLSPAATAPLRPTSSRPCCRRRCCGGCARRVAGAHTRTRARARACAPLHAACSTADALHACWQGRLGPSRPCAQLLKTPLVRSAPNTRRWSTWRSLLLCCYVILCKFVYSHVLSCAVMQAALERLAELQRLDAAAASSSSSSSSGSASGNGRSPAATAAARPPSSSPSSSSSSSSPSSSPSAATASAVSASHAPHGGGALPGLGEATQGQPLEWGRLSADEWRRLARWVVGGWRLGGARAEVVATQPRKPLGENGPWLLREGCRAGLPPSRRRSSLTLTATPLPLAAPLPG